MDDPKCRKRTLDTIRNYHRGVSSLTDTGELFVGPVLDVTGTREREREREREKICGEMLRLHVEPFQGEPGRNLPI